MRVLAVFPYPTLPLLQAVRAKSSPDTYLMGLNRLGSEIQVDWFDPFLTRASDALWTLTRRGPIPERFFPANLIQQLRALGRQTRYDAVFMRDIKNTFLPALHRKAFGRKVQMVLLNPIVNGTGPYDAILSFCLREFDRICYDTKAMAEILEPLAGNSDRLWFLPYGVDTDFFSPPGNQLGDSIVSVGDTNRDYITLVRALRKVGMRGQILSSRVLPLPGKPPVDLPSLPQSVVSISTVSAVELRETYSRARIVIIPLNDTVTASGVTSLLEAMSMGKPVIVAGTMGIADYVVNGESGITYRPGDYLDLANQLQYALQDPSLLERIGRNAASRVSQSFSTSEEGRRIGQILGTRTCSS